MEDFAMSAQDQVQGAADDAKTQIAQLRKQVEQLMSERVTPALADAADRIQATSKQASDMARDQAEMLSEHVRDQPLIAVLVAAGVGYLLGRIAR
jgi:ElaB/YqjD/DUF883 family membrane-anchored ribosome-binding protein